MLRGRGRSGCFACWGLWGSFSTRTFLHGFMIHNFSTLRGVFPLIDIRPVHCDLPMLTGNAIPNRKVVSRLSFLLCDKWLQLPRDCNIVHDRISNHLSAEAETKRHPREHCHSSNQMSMSDPMPNLTPNQMEFGTISTRRAVCGGRQRPAKTRARRKKRPFKGVPRVGASRGGGAGRRGREREGCTPPPR